MNLETILSNRVLILDGAMGTMIQRYNLTEEDFRGERFKDFDVLLKGNNDLLSLTKPDVISEIHKKYLEAGSDIIETNTFNSTSISMQDYKMSNLAREINLAAAKIAREAADEYTAKTPNKPRFVAGSIGPTNKTASMSPRVEEPMFRAGTFDDFKIAYKEQILALVEGGVDILLIETIFDTLNSKAAILAAEEVAAETGKRTPIILSVTLSDKAGRTLSGQTLAAFVASVSHSNPLAIGLNCSLGAADLKPYVKELGKIAPFYISTYPNAGLPNQLGEYDETPEKMAEQIKEFIDEDLVNIIGGCCGTTPEHILKYVELVRDSVPHKKSDEPKYMQLSGLESLEVSPQINFLNIGERCNVSGSRRFLRLIQEKKYEEALTIARKQVDDGAQVLDINMDEGLLGGAQEMTNFLNIIASDPDVSRVPIMIDSSDWNVIEAGLKCVQGKSIVNSISLKNGEEEFINQAMLTQKYGAAVVVMAFDETGQADTFERRIEVCQRAYNLLVKNGFNPKDIIFDPNILAIATGMDEHKNYAIDFIKAVTWIKENLPHAKVSGGVSNLSFSFRGNEYIRELMHSSFLYHSIKAGLDMGIVNPAQSVIYEDIPLVEKELIEDVIFNRRDDATERLMAYAEKIKNEKTPETEQVKAEEWRDFSLEERLSYALVKGIGDFMEQDLAEALKVYPRAVDIIDKPLMSGMNRVGDLFGSGKMFLPQVVKAARAMKKAVAVLQPTLESEKTSDSVSMKAGKVLLATVKGDVHDIGKNIVSIVLSCNNFDIIDLGVMVPPEKIIETVFKEKPDIVGLSGLITPSLGEMAVVADMMDKVGLTVPLLIGGATTSKLHTALKIEPKYNGGPVVYVKDASMAPSALSNLMSNENREEFINNLKEENERLRQNYSQKVTELISINEARENAYKINWESYKAEEPNKLGRFVLEKINVKDIIPYLDWKFLFPAWNLSARFHTILEIGIADSERFEWVKGFREDDREKAVEAAKLYDDALAMLNRFAENDVDYIRAVYGIYEAYSENDTVFVKNINDSGCSEIVEFPFLRQQKKSKKNEYYCLSDFIAPKSSGKKDYIGAFAVTAGVGAEELMDKFNQEGDEYNGLLMKSLLDRLAEAATEWLHAKVRRTDWGYASNEDISIKDMLAVRFRGIRPAVGYPSIPDQTTNFTLHGMLSSEEIGITLTENGVMYPNAAVSGLFFANADSKYFGIGEIDEEQVEDYAQRKGVDTDYIKKFLLANLE